MTPFPTQSDDGGTDDSAGNGGSINDDAASGTDDTRGGTTNDDKQPSDDTNASDDTNNNNTTDDYYGPTNPTQSAKTNKPYYQPQGNGDAPGGKTYKHPYDNWSYDGGDVTLGKSAKAFAGKSGKNGKAFSKASKGGGYIDDDGMEDDGYPMRARLFSESVHGGENVR
jgi:hypothetical protein